MDERRVGRPKPYEEVGGGFLTLKNAVEIHISTYKSLLSESRIKRIKGLRGEDKNNPLNPPYQGDFPLGSWGRHKTGIYISLLTLKNAVEIHISTYKSLLSESRIKRIKGLRGEDKNNPLNPPYQGDFITRRFEQAQDLPLHGGGFLTLKNGGEIHISTYRNDTMCTGIRASRFEYADDWQLALI